MLSYRVPLLPPKGAANNRMINAAITAEAVSRNHHLLIIVLTLPTFSLPQNIIPCSREIKKIFAAYHFFIILIALKMQNAPLLILTGLFLLGITPVFRQGKEKFISS